MKSFRRRVKLTLTLYLKHRISRLAAVALISYLGLTVLMCEQLLVSNLQRLEMNNPVVRIAFYSLMLSALPLLAIWVSLGNAHVVFRASCGLIALLAWLATTTTLGEFYQIGQLGLVAGMTVLGIFGLGRLHGFRLRNPRVKPLPTVLRLDQFSVGNLLFLITAISVTLGLFTFVDGDVMRQAKWEPWITVIGVGQAFMTAACGWAMFRVRGPTRSFLVLIGGILAVGLLSSTLVWLLPSRHTPFRGEPFGEIVIGLTLIMCTPLAWIAGMLYVFRRAGYELQGSVRSFGSSDGGPESFKALNHVQSVSVFLIVQGLLGSLVSAAAILLLGGIAFFVPDPFDWEDWAFLAVAALLTVLGLASAILQVFAGIWNRRFRARRLGLIAIYCGILQWATIYTVPTSIILMIYGSMVYHNRAVKQAFLMGEQGASSAEILSRVTESPHATRSRRQRD